MESLSDDVVTRINARLVTPLNCEVGSERGVPDQALVVLSLGEPSGEIDLVALLPQDAARLGTMLAGVEIPDEPHRPGRKEGRAKFFSPNLSRAERRVRSEGLRVSLLRLRAGLPALGNHVDAQLSSIARSLRRQCPSRRAATSIERRVAMAILVAVDYARWSIPASE